MQTESSNFQAGRVSIGRGNTLAGHFPASKRAKDYRVNAISYSIGERGAPYAGRKRKESKAAVPPPEEVRAKIRGLTGQKLGSDVHCVGTGAS